MKTIFLIFSLFSLLSCASMQPTQLEISSANYGPVPEDIKEKAIAAIGRTLIDPWSARYRFCGPFREYLRSGPVWNQNVTYGWMLCGEVNSKNRLGGYTGWQEIAVFFSNGQPFDLEWKHSAFLWCGGVPGRFITRGTESRNYGCPEIK